MRFSYNFDALASCATEYQTMSLHFMQACAPCRVRVFRVTYVTRYLIPRQLYLSNTHLEVARPTKGLKYLSREWGYVGIGVSV